MPRQGRAFNFGRDNFRSTANSAATVIGVEDLSGNKEMVNAAYENDTVQVSGTSPGLPETGREGPETPDRSSGSVRRGSSQRR